VRYSLFNIKYMHGLNALMAYEKNTAIKAISLGRPQLK